MTTRVAFGSTSPKASSTSDMRIDVFTIFPTMVEAFFGESLLGIRRAGADVILTYWAVEVAHWLRAGKELA